MDACANLPRGMLPIHRPMSLKLVGTFNQSRRSSHMSITAVAPTPMSTTWARSLGVSIRSILCDQDVIVRVERKPSLNKAADLEQSAASCLRGGQPSLRLLIVCDGAASGGTCANAQHRCSTI